MIPAQLAVRFEGAKELGNLYAELPKGAGGKVDPKISNAWYNYRVVYVMWGAEGPGNQGAAQAIHNFKRSVVLASIHQ